MDDLPKIKEEWTELIDQKREAQAAIINGDIYSTIEYLSFLDQFSKWMVLNLYELENAKPNFDVTELKTMIQQKLDAVEDEYTVLSDETLRHCEDLVNKYTDGQKNEDDKNLILQEMKDSLEDYRVAREDYITALEIPFKQISQDKEIPEDVGEESPEVDNILSQLDSIITSCDYALMISDIEE